MRVGWLVGWLVLLWPAVSPAAGPGEQLVEAVRNGDAAVVRALVERGVDVTAPAGDGATALHWAAYADDLETAELLLRAGASVDATNDLGVTPLWVAGTNGSAGMVARLLAAGADPNIAPATGGTPLMRAVRTGNAGAVESLLAAGADVNASEGSRGQTALMWAVTQRHSPVARLLIDRGADLEARTTLSRQLVLTCCQENNTDGNGSIWIDQGGFTPLLFAARLGDLAAAGLLLAAGAHVDVATPGGTTALVVAAHSGHGALAALLLENGADPNAAGAGYTALHAAVLRDDPVLVEALLAHGANPNARLVRGTPARRGGADFAFNKHWLGATPLWLAAGFHQAALVHVLAAGGADPLLPRNDGTTPLMAAAQGESPRALFQDASPVFPPGEERPTLEVVQTLVELGADVAAVNAAGDTALHRAASKRFDAVVRFLADRGATLNARDARGRTPLACAVRHCHILSNTEGSFVEADFRALAGSGSNSTTELLRRLGATE